jgi:DNA-binding NarL/FixJ family response regulator
MEKITVSLISSETLYREGVRAIVSMEQDLELIDECEQNEETFARLQAASPDVVVFTPKAPIVKSLRLVFQIKRHLPKVPVILLADAEDEELLFLGVKLGAAAYLTKGSPAEELVDAIRRTFQGEYLINETVMTNPRVASRILRQFQALPDSHLVVRGEEPLLSPLSHREVEVLKCIAQGNSNKHAGHILGISEQTVKNHVSSILRKLVANDRTHAVIIALRQGLIGMDEELITKRGEGSELRVNKAVNKGKPIKRQGRKASSLRVSPSMTAGLPISRQEEKRHEESQHLDSG